MWLLVMLSFAASTFAGVEPVSGLKYPNELAEGIEPIRTTERTAKSTDALTGYTDLLKHLLPSPNQDDGGTCLYMSTTGVAEWWLSRLNPQQAQQSEGSMDLSERFLMNASKTLDVPEEKNWRTDKIYVANRMGGWALNRDYRYTKGWFERKDGSYVPSTEGADRAKYGTKYNWINRYNDYNGPLKALPVFDREVLHREPGKSQWNVGGAPKDIVKKVQQALRQNEGPVSVMYNHYGYWHVVYVVGYSDQESAENCKFTRGFVAYMEKKAKKYRDQANATSDADKRERLLKKAKRDQGRADLVNGHLTTEGCRAKGVFYVRDSIYPDKNEAIYDYDLTQTGEEDHYSSSIIFREYEWLETLANNVWQIVVH